MKQLALQMCKQNKTTNMNSKANTDKYVPTHYCHYLHSNRKVRLLSVRTIKCEKTLTHCAPKHCYSSIYSRVLAETREVISRELAETQIDTEDVLVDSLTPIIRTGDLDPSALST